MSPLFPKGRIVELDSTPLVFEAHNPVDGTPTQISAADLKEEAFWRHYSSGLLFSPSSQPGRSPSSASARTLAEETQHTPPPSPNTIIANHAIGLKIHGNAFGKTCLRSGNHYLVTRPDENMASSIIIYEDDSAPFWCREEYSVAEDSVSYSRITIKPDSRAWYNSDHGTPAAWLFHERTLSSIHSTSGYESESEFDFANEICDSKLHGVVFSTETEGQYLGPDNRYDDRLLVDVEGVEFSIKRENLLVEVEVIENAYAQKLRANYGDPEQFWFQFGDKVWVDKEDEFDDRRVVVTYDDEKFSIAKEYIGM